MKQSLALLLSATVLFGLSACGMFKDKNSNLRNRSKDYLRTDVVKDMELPEGMQAPAVAPLYPIPEVHVTDEFGDRYERDDYQVPRPNTINTDELAFGIKIQKLGDERWLYLSASTSAVWPRTQNFLNSVDAKVVASNARTGVIETDWLQYKDEADKMMRFRITLEKGIHPDTTEIHVLQYEVAQGSAVPAANQWPPTSSNPEREEWMLRELADHLAKTVDTASASLLGQNVGGEVKAYYLKNQSEPTLALRLSNERAWASLTHAANKGGFVLWGKEREQGVLYAGYYEDQEKERGWFKTVITLGIDNKLPEKSRYSIDEMLQHLSGANDVRSLFDAIPNTAYGDALKKANAGYLIVTRRVGDEIHVVLRDERGRKLAPDEAKQLLRLLRKNLV
ncbi:outer membrane protein assembly factor BamC [Agaribacterium haliotis]|uniref:outer membrane protein assembly factor BamC n=1 Tax=Agaribacterium haliotis TaxID=2013869 RepID=UPI000BB5357E|nr:outer membrane protein assembly factor BamC [Agaribacterium haliotis]